MLVGCLIEIGLLQDGMFIDKERSILECRPSALRVTGQIIVGPVRNALDFVELFSFFALGKESIKEVRCCLGIMRKVVGRLRVLLEILRTDAVLVIPRDSLFDPAPVPLFVCARHNEVFYFHLLELAHPKNEILRCDFIPVRLADLCNAEGQLAVR